MRKLKTRWRWWYLLWIVSAVLAGSQVSVEDGIATSELAWVALTSIILVPLIPGAIFCARELVHVFRRDEIWRVAPEIADRLSLNVRFREFWLRTGQHWYIPVPAVQVTVHEQAPDAATDQLGSTSPPLPLHEYWHQLPDTKRLVLVGDADVRAAAAAALARALVRSPRRGQPAPVLFCLRAWDPELERLEDVMVDQLVDRYGLYSHGIRARDYARSDLRNGRICPLIEGLDSIRAREDALAQIKQLRAFVLTCGGDVAAVLTERPEHLGRHVLAHVLKPTTSVAEQARTLLARRAWPSGVSWMARFGMRAPSIMIDAVAPCPDQAAPPDPAGPAEPDGQGPPSEQGEDKDATDRFLLAMVRADLPPEANPDVHPRIFSTAMMRTLAIARYLYDLYLPGILRIEQLPEETRRQLAAIVRYDVVRFAARRQSPVQLIHAGLVLMAAAFCLLAPPIATQLWVAENQAPSLLRAGALCYVTLFSLLALAYFTWFGSDLAPIAGVATLVLVPPTITAVLITADPMAALALGASAAGLAVVVGASAHFGDIIAGKYVSPFMHGRYHLHLTPPQVIVVNAFATLLLEFDSRKRAWCQHRMRAALLSLLESRISWLDQSMVRATRFSRAPYAARTAAVRRYRSSAQFLNGIAVKLGDARTAEEFDGLTTALRDSVVEIANGNWNRLSEQDQPPHSPRWRRLLRRSVPSLVFFVTALAIPYVPAITVDPTALASFQIGLVVAGLLSLTTLDDGSRKHILTAFQHSPGKTS